jgi:protein-S-isoprenylcysteine O-methyltransferase Ste14
MAVLGTAAGLAGSAAGLFRSGGTTLDPHHPERSTALVTGGVYGLTRNPIYLGLALVLVAHAVHRGSLLALLPIAGYLAWVDRIQIPAEEEALRSLFGTEWVTYCSSVPRWLGPPRRPLTQRWELRWYAR